MSGSFSEADGLSILPATPEHVPAIQSMTKAAYSKYVPRMNQLPAPMLADYPEIMKSHDVYVLQISEDRIVGSIVLSTDNDAAAVQVNSLVVDPTAQGRGYGRILMSHAETVARRQGLTALKLYTNVKMYENLALYPKLGFLETDRRTEDGYQRVYFRKDLA